jgi:hypothetical protein
MKRSQYRLYLILAGVGFLAIPLVIRGLKDGLPAVLNISTLDQLSVGFFSGLVAAFILDIFLKQSLIQFEERIISTLFTIQDLGIDAIAKRTTGGSSTIGRTTVPSEMIKSARGEIILLAVSGKGTICGMKGEIKAQLKQYKNLQFGVMLLSPSSVSLSRIKGKNEKELRTEINLSINTLKELNTEFRGRIHLKTLSELPTFTSTAIDTEILSDIAENGLIGFQPWLDGDIHHGLILDVRRKNGGIWSTFVKALTYYWNNSVEYNL